MSHADLELDEDGADPMTPDEDVDESSATTALQLRSPGVPVTLNQLAALRGDALEVLETRVILLETARKRALRMTAPRDWTLNQAPTGAVTGFLEDAGCQRIRDVIGIAITRAGDPVKVMAGDGKHYAYFVSGDGRSTFTGQRVRNVEGGRSSDEDFFVRQKLSGAVLELKVRKAARANLNGTIVRELAGLKNVALEDIVAAWEGTGKTPALCNKGHGYGSGDERAGAERAGVPDVPAPPCPICPKVNGQPVATRYKDSARGGFYYCPNWNSHPANSARVTIDAAKWVTEYTATQQKTAAAAAPKDGGPREPGAEG